MPEKQLTDSERWDIFLTSLEAGLSAADSGLFVAEDDADSPVVPNPGESLPVELRERAQSIQAAQDRVIERLTVQRDQVGRHIAALRSIPSGHDGDRPAYLDTIS